MRATITSRVTVLATILGAAAIFAYPSTTRAQEPNGTPGPIPGTSWCTSIVDASMWDDPMGQGYITWQELSGGKTYDQCFPNDPASVVASFLKWDVMPPPEYSQDWFPGWNYGPHKGQIDFASVPICADFDPFGNKGSNPCTSDGSGGSSGSDPTNASVPEPAGFGLISAVMCALAWRRRTAI